MKHHYDKAGKAAEAHSKPVAAAAHAVAKGRKAGPLELDPAAEHEAEVRELAYALYEARGRADGHDLEDWHQAEAQVLRRLQRQGH